MASLSDQIDRLTANTRSLKDTAAQIAPRSNKESTIFTRAVLDTHLGDLIRDVDPSELGLFRLVQNPTNSAYDKDARAGPEPEIRRTQFSGATPLRKNPASREDKQEIDPEVYAHAALKYIDQYEPIRLMPRAYDQIVAVLNKIHSVRNNIETLSATLEQAMISNKAPPPKVRVEQEERRIKELQNRIEELKKKMQISINAKKPVSPPPTNIQEGKAKAEPSAVFPSSPQEEKFWTTPGEPSRVLRFSENLLDEEVNLADMSSASFGSPVSGSSNLKPLKLFGELESVGDIPHVSFDGSGIVTGDAVGDSPVQKEINSNPLLENTVPSMPVPIVSPEMPRPKATVSDVVADTPSTKQRKIKVTTEVERIVSKIWTTVGDLVMHPSHLPVGIIPSVNETLSHLQQLASLSPLPESPLASTVSSVSGEGATAPTFQQIHTAHLLVMLLSAPPSYSMPLNQVKDNLALKAKGSGQGTTRVLFGCVAKRLVKIDRSGREQIVKFDV